MDGDIASPGNHDLGHRPSTPIDNSEWMHSLSQDAQELQPLQSTRNSRTFDDDVGYPESNEHNSEVEPKQQSRSELIDRWWIYEAIALFSSIGCFAALVAVLGVSNGKEQSSWLFGHLTLNGLVALLSTLMRASMMGAVASALAQLKWNLFFSPSLDHPRPRKLEDFSTFDQASRGVWGSIRLMVSGAPIHIGIIGSIITVFTLAFDTFSQQVIILENKNVSNAPGTAIGRLDRSDFYSCISTTLSGQPLPWTPDLTTKAATYAGYFNYANISPPVAQCSTGNCTWPITPSLGVCGSCIDMTDEVTYVCQSDGDNGATKCIYSVPGTNPFGRHGYNFTLSDSTNPALVLTPFVTSHYNDSKTMYIEQFIQVGVPITQSSSPTVRGCGLWFCVQAYNTTTTNGISTQRIISNWSESNMNDLKAADNLMMSLNFTNIPDSYNVPKDTGFSVAGMALINPAQAPLINYTVECDGNLCSYYGNGNANGNAVNDISEELYKVADWDFWIDQFALSMSNNVRKTGNNTSDPEHYDGQVFSSVVFVRVRWAWLAFPITMLAGSIIFFVVTVWETHRQHVRPWKSDPIALLLCSVDGTIREKYNRGENIEKERMLFDYQEQEGIFRRAEM